MGWIGVETNGGAALLAQWAAGSETLYITGATVGSGYVEEANMRIATDLQSEKADASIVETVKISNGIKMRVRISASSGTAYTAHEVGIWAKLGASGTETLIQLHQNSGDGQPIPTATESPDYAFDLICVMAISNTGSLTVTIDTSVIATVGQLQTALAAYKAALKVDFGTVSSLPAVVSDDMIAADYIVTGFDIADEEAFTDGPTVTVAAGSATLSGTLETGGSTAVVVYLTRGDTVS